MSKLNRKIVLANLTQAFAHYNERHLCSVQGH